MDDEGHLVPVGKVIGRKKSILTLADQIATSIVAPEEQVIFISHGDCVEEAEFLAKKIKEKVQVKDVVINMLEPPVAAFELVFFKPVGHFRKRFALFLELAGVIYEQAFAGSHFGGVIRRAQSA